MTLPQHLFVAIGFILLYGGVLYCIAMYSNFEHWKRSTVRNILFLAIPIAIYLITTIILIINSCNGHH